jgi:bifunctional NMN adenylyltransferase/nudix hydrolase
MASTGVIIGRFQVFELSDLIKNLIESVRAKHDVVMVFMGSNPAPSDMNPLDWVFRAQMFEEAYGTTLPVHELPDLPDDRVWSQELDRRILEQRPSGKVVIYGSEEGFTSRYSGQHSTEVLEADIDPDEVVPFQQISNMRDFRAGALYGAFRRFPTVYPTVDIAVFNMEMTQVLLARKEKESKFRFPGGFVDPEDESYEMAAVRELLEECGEEIEVINLVYIGSCKINDWRYHGSLDGIMTHLYACFLESGTPEANDDIEELKWFDLEKLQEEHFVPEHQELFAILKSYLEEEQED